MRVYLNHDVDAEQFAKQLIEIGEGKIKKEANSTKIKLCNDFGIEVNTTQELKNNVFPNIIENYKDREWLCERVILASRNEIVNNSSLRYCVRVSVIL